MRKAQPTHLLDRTLWPILQYTWERVGDKHAHFWHWRDVPKEWTTIPPVVLGPDPSAGDRSRGFWANLWHTNFGWKNVAVLEPIIHTGEYQIGYIASEGGRERCQLCSVVLTGQTGVLQGPYFTRFFGRTLDGRPIELRLVRMTTKSGLGEITLI